MKENEIEVMKKQHHDIRMLFMKKETTEKCPGTTADEETQSKVSANMIKTKGSLFKLVIITFKTF